MRLKELIVLVCIPFIANAGFFDLPSNTPEPFKENLLRENPTLSNIDQDTLIATVLARKIKNTDYALQGTCINYTYYGQNDKNYFKNCFVIQGNQIFRRDETTCETPNAYKKGEDCYRYDTKIMPYVKTINKIQKDFVTSYDKELSKYFPKSE